MEFVDDILFGFAIVDYESDGRSARKDFKDSWKEVGIREKTD